LDAVMRQWPEYMPEHAARELDGMDWLMNRTRGVAAGAGRYAAGRGITPQRASDVVVRQWPEYTDSTPLTPDVNWEQNKKALEAGPVALEGIAQDGEITRQRASDVVVRQWPEYTDSSPLTPDVNWEQNKKAREAFRLALEGMLQ